MNSGLCDGAHTSNSGGEYACQLQCVAHLLSNDSLLDVVEGINYHQYITIPTWLSLCDCGLKPRVIILEAPRIRK